MRCQSLLLGCLILTSLIAQQAWSDTWRVGTAKAVITPTEPMWMAGYAARNKPAQGKATELYAKSMVLEVVGGPTAVLVTLDLVGIDRELALEVREKISSKHDVLVSNVLLCSSHTHSGPVVKRNLGPLHFYRLDPDQRAQIDQYADRLSNAIVECVDQAMLNREPSTLAYGVGTANFAVNRRNNKEPDVPKLRTERQLVGPTDHEVPVLTVRNASGKTTAILFGYACHATVLSEYDWSGDYPGYAQIELENRYPGCTALFFAGCGADQNPTPRRTVELAQHYGRHLATAVDQVILTSVLKELKPSLAVEYREIEISFAKLPTVEELQKTAESESVYEVLRAKHLLAGIEQGKPLAASYPYPVSTWRLGNELNWIALGGEVVVDYSIRVKTQQGQATWVAGYSHDVMAYIPSNRVLHEGGYEGEGAMVYYGLPSKWSDDVERNILEEVERQNQVLKSSLVPAQSNVERVDKEM